MPRRCQNEKQSTVESLGKHVARHDPLLSGIQPHKLMRSTDTFQMPSLTTCGAYDTGKGSWSWSWW